MAREVGISHWTNTREGKLPSKSRFGPDHERRAGATAFGKKLRNRQNRRRSRRNMRRTLG